jgi:hypothetical protein
MIVMVVRVGVDMLMMEVDERDGGDGCGRKRDEENEENETRR